MAWKGKTISSCISKIFMNGDFSDVVFIFKKNGQTSHLQAHKLLLALRSDVFAAMFYGLASDNQQEIEITDIDYETFRIVLQAIYTDEVEICDWNIYLLLQTAHKYHLQFLMEKCQSYLEKNTCISNACSVLSWARHLDITTLAEKTVIFIQENAVDIFNTEGFVSLTKENLAFILSRDDICSVEERIVVACIKWAENVCREKDLTVSGNAIREALGPVIYALRIPLLSLETFSSIIINREILSGEEELGLYKYLTMTNKCVNDLCGFEARSRTLSPVTVELENILSKPKVNDLSGTCKFSSIPVLNNMYNHTAGSMLNGRLRNNPNAVKKTGFQTLCILSTRSIILNDVTLECAYKETLDAMPHKKGDIKIHDVSLFLSNEPTKSLQFHKNEKKVERINIPIRENKKFKIECYCKDVSLESNDTNSDWREFNIWDEKTVFINTNWNMSIIRSMNISLKSD